MVDTERINAKVKELGFTQKEIADRLGLSQSTLNLKINNKRPIELSEAEKLQQILGISDKDFSDYFFYTPVA